MAIRSHRPYVRISVGTLIVPLYHGTLFYTLRCDSSSRLYLP